MTSIEILSPSSVNYDRGTKRLTYEQAGVPAYWIVDPDAEHPLVTVLEWTDGELTGERSVDGGDELTVDRPYPIALRPADLVVPGGGRRPR